VVEMLGGLHNVNGHNGDEGMCKGRCLAEAVGSE
jgi:hypothetical protein